MPTQRIIQGLGWRPDLPDHRDLHYAVAHPDEAASHRPIRASVLNSHRMPKDVYDQGDIGSCTANSSSSAMKFLHPGFDPSRLALYYESRKLEGTVDQDSGAMLRDVIKVLAAQGVGYESEWPYITAKFKDAPPAFELRDAAKFEIKTYSRLTTGADFRNCIVAGFPFVIGFSVYESFEGPDVAASGLVPMPTAADSMVGGHAVLVIGYDDSLQLPGVLHGLKVYLVRNSWGPSWGLGGNFYIPAAYLENPGLASDAWTIRV